MDLSTKVLSLTLDNPLLPGSGPLSGNAERMIYLAKQNIGGIVTKTIAPKGAEVVRPCIAGTKDALFNAEAWSEYDSERWADEFLPQLRETCPDTPVVASIGYDDEDLKIVVPMLEELVDGFEYVPRYVGKNFEEVTRIVRTLRDLTDKPIWVKLLAYISDPIGFAGACKAGGADGIVAMTSFGPNMFIDIMKRRPVIGIPGGYVWTSGPYIKPIALAYVNMIKEAYPEMSVIGCGGCSSADDVIEFLLAGADAVQILTAAIMKGHDYYSKILADLPKALEKYGFKSIEDVKATGLTKTDPGFEPSFPVIDYEKCTKCGLCVNNCPYFGMEMTESGPKVNTDKCFGCGYCESRCPVSAISGVIG